MSLVNEGIVEEVLLPLGQLDFGKGLIGKCDIALWRTRGEHRPLVGEFAFQVKFDRRENVGKVSIGLLLAGCFSLAKGAIFGIETAAIAGGSC